MLDSRAFTTETAARTAAALKSLADPHRLRMLSAIGNSDAGEVCVCDLGELTDLSQPTVSHHLKVMREAGVLESERRGTWVWYRLAGGYRDAVTAMLEAFASASQEAPPAPGPLPGLEDADAALASVAASLSQRFPDLSEQLVTAIVRESYAGLARTAQVSSYLVPLAERFSRQRLVDLTRDRASGIPQVLFVCVANAGRSQLAAALTTKYAGDRITVRSAGSQPASGVHPTVREVLDELGTVPDPYPKPLTDDAVRAADVVITMGCGDVCPVIPGVSYRDWAVGDPALASIEGVRAIADDIDARVRNLVVELLPGIELPAA